MTTTTRKKVQCAARVMHALDPLRTERCANDALDGDGWFCGEHAEAVRAARRDRARVPEQLELSRGPL